MAGEGEEEQEEHISISPSSVAGEGEEEQEEHISVSPSSVGDPYIP